MSEVQDKNGIPTGADLRQNQMFPTRIFVTKKKKNGG
tara:strand:- start:345 stop:455 length:111 start_codon:yes stop_codon:yes gene_type:complete